MSFPLLLHMAYLSQLTRLLVKFLLYNAWSPTYLLEHTMATNHGLLGKDEALTIYCIIALHFTVMPPIYRAWLSLPPY